MKITIDVPDRALFALTDRAEASDMTVAEYLLQSGLTIAGITKKREDTIVQLHSLGMTDKEMARYLNTTNASVAQRRRLLGLPANHAGQNRNAA